uniref:Uncharacterized protein n=1 Tax=Anguilla anguilla TaxID=7936 RepID=A0A0E9T5L0_ANGAN
MLHVQCFPGNQTQNSEFRNVIVNKQYAASAVPAC